MRTATVTRQTRETDIALTLCLDGSGRCDVSSGVGFFDHLLTALALHGGFDLSLSCAGDLQVDCHHTVEDVGLVLGDAFKQALGELRGIRRFGEAMIPMDEALARAVADAGGRPYLVFDADFTNERIGALDTQMIREFWHAFAARAGVTLHLAVLYGQNDHHKAEALFKAAGRALRQAVSQEGEGVPSTKGVL